MKKNLTLGLLYLHIKLNKLFILSLIFYLNVHSLQAQNNHTEFVKRNNIIELNKYFITDVDGIRINLKTYVDKNNIKLILFYNHMACYKCFFNNINQLKKLTDRNDFIIITDFDSLRELKAFSYNNQLKDTFLINETLFHFNCYYNINRHTIFIIGKDENLNDFLNKLNP